MLRRALYSAALGLWMACGACSNLWDTLFLDHTAPYSAQIGPGCWFGRSRGQLAGLSWDGYASAFGHFKTLLNCNYAPRLRSTVKSVIHLRNLMQKAREHRPNILKSGPLISSETRRDNHGGSSLLARRAALLCKAGLLLQAPSFRTAWFKAHGQ